MRPLKLNLIAACDAKMGIGVKNDLPWRLRKEMAYFNRMTTGKTSKDPGSEKKNVVLMGRLTYDSIPEKFRPLKGRLNIVLSRNKDAIEPKEDLVLCTSWQEAMDYLSTPETQQTIEDVWITGGSHIYKMAIDSSFCHRIYLTRIQNDYNCDVFFPEFEKSKFKLVKDPEVPDEEQQEGDVRYKIEIYERVQS